MIKKLMILISLILISIIGVYAGTFSESGGVPTWDGSLMCVDGQTSPINIANLNGIVYIKPGDNIQARLDYANINNIDSIHLIGNHNLDSNITLYSNMTLYAFDAIINKTNINATIILNTNATGVTIKGIIFLGNDLGNGSNDVNFIDLGTADEVNNIIIENCLFKDLAGRSIQMAGTEIYIRDNRFLNVFAGVGTEKYKNDSTYREFYVLNNYIENENYDFDITSGDEKGEGVEINIHGNGFAEISSNKIIGFREEGIDFNIANGIISNNYIANYDNGLLLTVNIDDDTNTSYLPNVIVSGNFFISGNYDCSDNMVDIKDASFITFSDNYFEDTYSTARAKAIALYGGGISPIKHITFEGNIFNHVRGAYDLTPGTNYINTDTISMIGNHYVDIGNNGVIDLGSGVYTPIMIDIGYENNIISNIIRFEVNTTTLTCDSSNLGVIIFDGASFLGCNSTNWNTLG